MFFIYIHNRQQKDEAKDAENALGDKKFLNAIFLQKKKTEWKTLLQFHLKGQSHQILVLLENPMKLLVLTGNPLIVA